MFNINKNDYKERMKRIIIPHICKCGVVMGRRKGYYINHYKTQRHQSYLQDNLFHLLDLI